MEPYLIVLSAFGLLGLGGGLWLTHVWLTKPQPQPLEPLFHDTRTAHALSDRVDSLHELVNESRALSRGADHTADKAVQDVKKAREQLNGTISGVSKRVTELDTLVMQIIQAMNTQQIPQQQPQRQQGEPGPVDPQFDFSQSMR